MELWKSNVSYNKRRDCFHFYKINKLDIVFLQETHSVKHNEKVWNTQFSSKIWFSHGTTQSRGVAILFSKQLEYTVHNVITDENGRYIILYCTILKKKILLCNLYAPNVDDPIFFQSLFDDIKRFSPDHMVIGGDFNLVMDLDIDKQGGTYTTHTKARDKVVANMKALDLIDIWRQQVPDRAEFTYRKLKPNPIFVRLDFFLINESLCQMVDECEI